MELMTENLRVVLPGLSRWGYREVRSESQALARWVDEGKLVRRE
jgi:hypothetical protein